MFYTFVFLKNKTKINSFINFRFLKCSTDTNMIANRRQLKEGRKVDSKVFISKTDQKELF